MRLLTALILLPLLLARADEPLRLDGPTYATRATALVAYVATCRPSPKDELVPKASAPACAARLLLHTDTNYALHTLDASAAHLAQGKGTLDPFDKVALVNTWFLCRDQIPDSTTQHIRAYVARYAHKVWKGYGAMNYRLMNDGAGFLAAEVWTNLVDADGLSAPAIRDATRERLFGYFDTICRRNFDEYGAPIYLAVDLSAVRMLAEFAQDPDMRKRAALTLDAMLLDVACGWNQGYLVASASRAKYWGSTDTGPDNPAATATVAWLYFGAHRPFAAAGTGWIHSFWMAAPGKYTPPALLVDIARDRSRSFTHRGSVPASGDAQVHRTSYHTPTYSLASQWDHPNSPTASLYKEGRRHVLKWLSDRPSSTFAVCMENPRRPYRLSENVANALGYGENPFSRYLQHEGTLLGVYAVPDTYPYWKLYAPFTTRGAIVKRLERDGWILCHNGTMLMAFRSAQPVRWDTKPWNGCNLLWCDARHNAWVLETSDLAPFAGGGVDAELNRFADALVQRTKFEPLDLDSPQPRLRYTSLTGHVLDLTYLPHGKPSTTESRIDDHPVAYATWPLHDNAWVKQALDTPTLVVEHQGRRLTYDFDKWTRTESTTPRPPQK